MDNRYIAKDRSTLELGESVKYHIIWLLLFCLYFKNYFFMPLQHHTVSMSKLILFLSMVFSCVIGILTRWKRCLSYHAIFVDLILGGGGYMVAAYFPYYRMMIIVILLLAVIIFSLFFLAVFCGKINGIRIFRIKNVKRRRFIFKNRFLKALHISGICIAYLFLTLFLRVAYNRIVYSGIIRGDNNHYKMQSQDSSYSEYGLKHNLETIEKIRENARWKPLSVQEKLNVLQCIANCECHYFGLPYEVTVVMDDLEGETLGDYNDYERSIRIDREHLEKDDAHQCFNTILHEMYHCYQYCLVNLYMKNSVTDRRLRVFEHVEEYIEEIKHYKEAGNSFESYMRYYNQKLEEDARKYAQQTVFVYYKEIDQLQDVYEIYQGEIIDSIQ